MFAMSEWVPELDAVEGVGLFVAVLVVVGLVVMTWRETFHTR